MIRVAIWFFVFTVSPCLSSSVVVTFCDSYTFSSIVLLVLGIHQRSVNWGWQGYLWIGVGLAARVAHRFFVNGKFFFVVCRRHFLQFVYLLIISFHCLRHQSTPHSMRMTGISLYWRRVGDTCCDRDFCVDGKCTWLFCRRHFFAIRIPSHQLFHPAQASIDAASNGDDRDTFGLA